MTIGTFKGYVLVIVGGLVVVAVAAFLVFQWDNQAKVTIGPVIPVPTWLLILCSGVGGVIVMWVSELFLHGWRILRSRPRR